MESKEINTSAEALVESADTPEAVQTAAQEATEEAAAETETVPPAEELSAQQNLSFTDEPRADQSKEHIKEINTSAETLAESPETPEAVQTAAPEAPEESAAETETVPAAEELSAEQILSFTDEPRADQSEAHIRAMVEAAIYITEEPLTVQLIAAALEQPEEKVRQYLDELAADYEKPGHGLTIKEVAGGYKMATKPQHHEAIRSFVRQLKPPLKLSLAAPETLSLSPYKPPITS